ncbi:ParM/StbA family protein [Solibacillus silvestris]
MDKLILGIDAGNHMAKVMGAFGTDKFRTNICDWFERDVEETFGPDDMEFEINGRKGYAGTIALYEDEFGNGSMYGDTKAHEDTKIRVLLAINRYLDMYCSNVGRVSVVVGQPIKRHKESEKNKIKEMLIGQHTIKVNGKTRSFYIENIGIAPEGSAAYWSRPQEGLIRIIDAGSGTVNAATIMDNRHVNTASDTFNFGAETVNNKNDYSSLSRGIIRNTTKLKWNKSDKVLICGGISKGIAPYIIEHYPNAEILNPVFKSGNEVKILDAVFANATGFYKIAKGAFE